MNISIFISKIEITVFTMENQLEVVKMLEESLNF